MAQINQDHKAGERSKTAPVKIVYNTRPNMNNPKSEDKDTPCTYEDDLNKQRDEDIDQMEDEMA